MAQAPARGSSYTKTEDLLISKAFISASEDSITGIQQKASQFQKKMHEMYVKLIEEEEASTKKAMEAFSASSQATLMEGPPPKILYDRRKPDSIMKRFKSVIMPVVNKFAGIVSTTPTKSGENEEDHMKTCMANYKKRFPHLAPIENYIECYEFLKVYPKFTAYCDLQDAAAQKRRERPQGTKSAKKAKEDNHHIDSIVKKTMEAAGGSFGAAAGLRNLLLLVK